MDPSKVCRTCLSMSADMKSLYEICATSTQICFAEMLSSFTSLKCFGNDGLPAQICNNCTDILSLFHTFQLKCLESDTALRNYFGKPDKTNNKTFEHVLVNTELPDGLEICPIYEENSNSEQDPSPDHLVTKSLNDPLNMTEIKSDLDQKLDLIKHEVDIIKIERKEDVCPKNDTNTESSQVVPTFTRRYWCSICGSSFKRKSYLKDHIRKHTGERPFSCEVCGITFNRKRTLQDHMGTHTEEKPFVCTMCDRAYKHKSNLTIHIRSHTGAKPYACNFCESTFKQKSNLSVHMRNHTGEKPHSCTICDCSFSRKCLLNVHMRKHKVVTEIKNDLELQISPVIKIESDQSI